MEKCTGCKENKFIARRDLCTSCYQAARKLIRENKTTWKELEEKGLVSPKKSPGRQSIFLKRFNEL